MKNVFIAENLRIPASRRLTLLFPIMVSGSVLGAWAAGCFLAACSGSLDLSSVFSLSRSVRFSRSLILLLLFPVLLFAAGFSRRPILIFGLFFCRGVVAGYHLWLTGFLLRTGIGAVSLILFLLSCLLPLPVCLLTAAFFLQERPPEHSRTLCYLLFLHCAVIGLASILRSVLL